MYKIAIVGATGLVGRSILTVLEERKHNNYEYKLFCSKKNANKKITFLGTEYITHELTESSFDEHFDFAIFSAGSHISSQYAPYAVKNNCIVIDNSSFFRMNPTVPLVVPEVNPKKVFEHNGIIANPNCSTIQAVVALKPLDDKYKIKRIIYSTYQAVSGAGKYGLEDLLKHNSGKNLKKFPYQIYNNCLPHIDIFEKDGYTKEEYKLINGTKKILNKNISVTATAVRIPVENCHSESINVEFENSYSIEELKKLLNNSPGIIVQDDIFNNIYPMPIHSNGHDEVFVGRIRRDFSQKNTLNFWVVSDNIRKGAATNAVQILEKLIEKN